MARKSDQPGVSPDDSDGSLPLTPASLDVSTEVGKHELEERLAEAQRIARMGSWSWDSATDRAWWSESTYELYGVDRATFKPNFESYLALVHPDDRSQAVARIDSLRAGAHEIAGDLRIVRPDGAIVWMHSRIRASRDSQGKVVRFEGTDLDVTDRKRAEEEMRDSEQRFRDLADAIPQIVWIARPDGGMLHLNAKACEYSGITEGELTEWRWERCVHPDDLPELVNQWKETLRLGIPRDIEFRLRRADGQFRWHVGRQRPTRDATGNVVTWYGTCTDIEDIKQAEQALRKSEEQIRDERDRFAKIAATMPGAILSFRLRPDGSACLPYASPGIESIYGIKPESLQNDASPLWAIFHPDDLPGVQSSIAESARLMSPWYGHFRVQNHQKGEVWVEINSMPIAEPDGSIIWHGVAMDVTQRKRAEAEQKKLISLIEHSKDFIALANLDGQLTFMNAGARQMIGVDDQEEIGHIHFTDYVPVEWQNVFRNTVIPAVLEYKLWEGEMQLRHRKTGALIDVFRSTFLFRDTVTGADCFATVTRDVTLAKQAVKVIEDRERLLGIVTRSARVGMVVVNDHYEYLFANEAYAEILGLETSKIVGRRVPEILPFAWEKIQPRLDEALTGKRVAFEMTLPPLPGATEIRWFKVTYEPSLGEMGRPSVVVVVTEITEQKRTDVAIRESEERFRSVLDHSPAVIYLKDLSGRYLFVNRQVAESLQVTPQEVIGKTVYDFFPQEAAAQIERMDRRVIETLRPQQTNDSIQLPNGRQVELLTVLFPLFRSDGQPYAICGISNDITDWKQAKEERDRLWNYAQDPMCVAGFDGYLKQVNPAWTRSLGWSEQELVGHHLKTLIHPDDWELTLRAIERLESGETIREIVNRYRCKNGSYRYLSWHAIPVIAAGAIYGLARDVTEERQLAEQFHQSQKMEAIGRLAGGVAHDFNNLLTVILGHSELILAELPQDNPMRESLGAIQVAGQRAARLTRQLLAFSRNTIFAPKVLDFSELVAASAKFLQRLIGEDVKVTVVSDTVTRQIKADPGQLEQVIMNLVVNARYAMPTGGQLTLATRNVTLGGDDLVKFPALPPGHYLEFLVTDTGHGMSDDVKQKIFEPFFTTKEVGQGTGLGLAVVHGVIQQCGGAIEVESALGVGTTFRILIPAIADAVPDQVASISPDTNGTQTILLVEDEDAVRKIARIALESKGYTILEARNGAEALELADGYPGPIHLLITDVVMPELGGRALADAMVKRRPSIRILYISGFTDDAIVRHGIEASTDAFLQKPFSPLSFDHKVREVLVASRGMRGE